MMLTLVLALCFAFPVSQADEIEAHKLVALNEVWAYLMTGEEAFFKPELQPISDLAYFSAEINAYGELIAVPNIKKLSNYSGRKHLVVAEVSSYSIMHFCLDPVFNLRDKLIDDIVKAAAPFDGVQIDFETIPSRDINNFVEFLRILKSKLNKKILSVAMAAKVSAKSDILNYKNIALIVDKIIIMAYDEHWSGSKPGPVASIDWCKRVTDYVTQTIPKEKLVMGLPFYGRAWGNKTTSRAYKFSSIETLKKDKAISEIQYNNGLPWFTYEENVKVEVHYDNANSTESRLRMYTESGIQAVAFWRLGQEDSEIWARIRLE